MRYNERGRTQPKGPGISDKVAAITGASSDIGSASALLLAERGASVVLGAQPTSRSDRPSRDRRVVKGDPGR